MCELTLVERGPRTAVFELPINRDLDAGNGSSCRGQWVMWRNGGGWSRAACLIAAKAAVCGVSHEDSKALTLVLCFWIRDRIKQEKKKTRKNAHINATWSFFDIAQF